MSSLIRLKAVAEMEFLGSERCDVSTITSKAVDNEGDIVIPGGLNFERFYDNGSAVNYQHSSVRVGRCLWIKAKGDKLIAKTQYDRAPKDWTASKPWVSDMVFDAVCKGVLTGKSITLLPEEDRPPTDQEVALGAKRVVTKGTVLEYSVCRAPVNPEAIVEEIKKALDEFINPEDLLKTQEQARMNELAAELKAVFIQLQTGGQ